MRNKLIKHLSEGLNQIQIAQIFKNENYKPNSLSSIEKEIYKLKEEYNAKTMFELGFKIAKSK
ncbi:hypothetical protein [Empedobacter sp.]|uniref:hypothetical protein n=1 Tax=Empedobacter sp. TaxID=1927715 RepID=UPI0028A1A8DD|nr:hypothetical protein [Empedobacter sp.]